MSHPNDLLQEFSRARLNEEAVSVERIHFYKTDRIDDQSVRCGGFEQ